jgi:hypothetical protein
MFDTLFTLSLLLLAGLSLAAFHEPTSSSLWAAGAVHEITFDPYPGVTGYVELVREDNTLVGPGKSFQISFDSGRFLFPLFYSATTFKGKIFLCPPRYCTLGKQGTLENPYLASELFTVEKKTLPLMGSSWYGILAQGRNCDVTGKGLTGKYFSIKWNDASATIQTGSNQPHEITYWRPTTSQTNFQANYKGELYCFYVDQDGHFRWSYDASFCPTLTDHAADCLTTLASADLSRDPYQYKWNPIAKGEFTGGLHMVSGSLSGKCSGNDILEYDTYLKSDKWDLQINTVDPNIPDFKLSYIHRVRDRPGFYYGVQSDTELLRCFNITTGHVLEMQVLPGGNCSESVLSSAPQCSSSSITVQFVPRDFVVAGFPGWATFIILSCIILFVGGIFGGLAYMYFKKWRNRNTYEVFTSNTKSYWTGEGYLYQTEAN